VDDAGDTDLVEAPASTDDERNDSDLFRRFEESTQRSRERRARRPRGEGRRGGKVGAAVAIGAIGAAAALVGPSLIATVGERGRELLAGREASGSQEALPLAVAIPELAAPRVATPQSWHRRPSRLPSRREIAAARRFADERQGLVSFAVVDDRGRMHGDRAARRYVSASVVKVMLLAAELDRLEADDAALDEETRELLHAMITYSDNDAADSIYSRVGDAGLFAVARRAGLRDFTVSGYWANAQISARDMAALMDRLRELLAGRNEDFGAGLLTAIAPSQRWGIPSAVKEGWRVRFKGGWRGTGRGQLVHQVARLERDHRALAVAVLTDAQPTQAYGIATVRGVAERLLARLP
jgi:beta-lactamase class A